MPRPRLRGILFGLALTLPAAAIAPVAASAADPASFALTIRDHRFSPAEVKVPANTPLTLRVTNADSTPEEFDSHALKAETVIAPGHTATIHVRPLSPGRYPFVGEYHEATAKGALTAGKP